MYGTRDYFCFQVAADVCKMSLVTSRLLVSPFTPRSLNPVGSSIRLGRLGSARLTVGPGDLRDLSPPE